MRALKLLVQTVPHVWKTNNEYDLPTYVVISQDHVNLWPDKGNLLALPDMAVIDEVDVKGKVLDPQDSDNNSCTLGNDGNDGEHAPLQTMQPPDVEFEAHRLEGNGNDVNGNEGDSNPLRDGILSPERTAAT
eukprot:15365075-Ditylum_brightwellii.AAC.1